MTIRPAPVASCQKRKKIMSEYQFAALDTVDGAPVLLKGVKVTGDLRGLLFEASVEQRFSNPSDKHVEVVYSFPLPDGGILLGVDVVLGGKQLSGSVVERKQAEASYENALADGDAAIMLEENHDRSYCLNLGNLAPMEDCIVTIRYAQTLQFEQYGLRLMIPTVIAPRFGDAVRDGGLRSHQVPETSFVSEYSFDLQLRLHGDLVKARIASPSHPISLLREEAEGDVVTLSLARNSFLDRDFVLVLDKLADNSIVVQSPDFAVPTATAVLASFCPSIVSEGHSELAVKLLVDCSGSMAGDSIEAARRALQAIVGNMSAGDSFSLSRFGSTVEHRSRGLWKTTETTKLAAQRWVANLDADLGGTATEEALESTFALTQSGGSDVLLITDGEFYAIDSTIVAAKKSGHRIFVVGIGSSPSESNLRRLAEATGGACDFVAPGEAVEPAVLRMFARLRSARLVQVSVVWPEGVRPLWASPINTAVFDGDTINLYALLDKPLTGDILLLGKRSGKARPEVIGFASLCSQLDAGDTLSRMTASIRYDELEMQLNSACLDEEEEQNTSAQATQLAVDYQLVTDKTNFLLLHSRAEGEKAQDMPELHKVAHMLPAGWGGVGSIIKCNEYNDSDISYSLDFDATDFDVSPLDAFDLPRCLRRKNQVCEMSDYLIDGFSDDNPRHWLTTDHYVGMTPLGLSQWLQDTPQEQWPATYAKLRDIGLGILVTDWLELGLAETSGAALAEAQVVRAFLLLLAQPEVFQALNEERAVGDAFAQVLLRYRDNPGSVAGLDATLLQSLINGLAGLTTVDWPEQMFDLESVDLLANGA